MGARSTIRTARSTAPMLPNLVNRFILGSGDSIAYGDTGRYGIGGWQNTGFATSPMRHHRPTTCSTTSSRTRINDHWRYQLTKNDGLNDGIPSYRCRGRVHDAPSGYLAHLIPIIRIK